MMNDPLAVLIAGRALERVLIVLGGFLCLWLGYRLFFLVASKSFSVKSVEGETAGVRFKAEGVAPGIFFAAFGCLVLGYAMRTRVEFSIKDVLSAGEAPKTASSPASSVAVAVARSAPVSTREIDLRMENSGSPDQYAAAFHAVNTLVNIRRIAASSDAKTLQSKQFDKFMAASQFLTFYQRAYIESKFGPGTYDNNLGCYQSTTPACVQMRADPIARKTMDSVLKALAGEVE